MKELLTILFIFSFFVAKGQPNVIFTHAQKIDEDRYEDYDRSPYQFKEWPLANIYDASGVAFEQLEFNINGFSNEIEIRKDGRFIELDQIAYLRIEATLGNQNILLKRGINGKFLKGFIEVLYEGIKIQLVRKFIVVITEKEFNDVGKTIHIKRFEPKFSYFLIRDGEQESIKLKKKLLFATLGHKKEIEKFSNKNKLKISNPDDLVKVLKYLEDNEF